jgi:hypothetical protein
MRDNAMPQVPAPRMPTLLNNLTPVLNCCPLSVPHFHLETGKSRLNLVKIILTGSGHGYNMKPASREVGFTFGG